MPCRFFVKRDMYGPTTEQKKGGLRKATPICRCPVTGCLNRTPFFFRMQRKPSRAPPVQMPFPKLQTKQCQCFSRDYMPDLQKNARKERNAARRMRAISGLNARFPWRGVFRAPLSRTATRRRSKAGSPPKSPSGPWAPSAGKHQLRPAPCRSRTKPH